MGKRRGVRQARAAPPKSKTESAWMCSPGAWDTLISGGYTKLADSPEVKMCANIYADMISSMTIHLMENTDRGDVRVKNELSRRVDISPNPLMTRKTLMYNIIWTMLLPGEGNQVTYPKYSGDGFLEELCPLPPSAVSFQNTQDGYIVRYGEKVFCPDEVLHFVMNPDPERPWQGTGFRMVLRDVVKGLRQANRTKQALMESPSPSIIVKVDGLSEDFASAEGRKTLREQYLDSSENGEPWFIPAEMFEVEQVKPLTLNDLAIKSSLELDKRTVAGIFGVPAFLVGVGEFKSEEFNHFVGTRIMPMAKIIEQELTRKLLLSPGWYWRFNTRSLYSYSLSDIITAGSEMVDRMAMRRNEWRDWIGMGPDADMGELLALENYIPASMLGQQNKLKGEKTD